MKALWPVDPEMHVGSRALEGVLTVVKPTVKSREFYLHNDVSGLNGRMLQFIELVMHVF